MLGINASHRSISPPSPKIIEKTPAKACICSRARRIFSLVLTKKKTMKGAPIQHASLLDAVETRPQRFRALLDTGEFLRLGAIRLSYAVYGTFNKLGDSFADIFCLKALVKFFQETSCLSLLQGSSPYLIVGGGEYLISRNAQDFYQFDKSKIITSFLLFGFFMSYKISEQPRNQNSFLQVLHQAASIWSIYNLHVQTYRSSLQMADNYLSMQVHDGLIVEDTKDSLSLLTGLITSMVILPKLMLIAACAINKQNQKQDRLEGRGSQNSQTAPIANGLTKEINLAMLFYEHFTSQLFEPSRLYQYFIVSLNVLKDVDIIDPLNPNPPPNNGWSRIVKRTRNVWLLVADSFLKARNYLTHNLSLIHNDTEINLKTYTVIRDGVIIKNICRFELMVGDLVSVEQAINVVDDPAKGSSRNIASLSGYLVQLDNPDKLKKVAVSLVELNGENRPLILCPLQEGKKKSSCVPVDLLTVPLTAGILPGTEFLSFDNEHSEASSEGLYLQIAAVSETLQHIAEPIAFSAQETALVKTRLIKGVLFITSMAALFLMRHKNPELPTKKIIQFYGTEFVDKFTQVFVEAQAFIPLISEVLIELINNELLKEINKGMKDKFTLNKALCTADLFEFLHRKKVRIYSDKTGTVTEAFMVMRDIVYVDKPGAREKIAKAFATIFSDQKTEAEENEIKRYFSATQGLVIESNPIPNQAESFCKKITHLDGDSEEFTTKRLGLFTELGGQFCLRLEPGHSPSLVFFGIPRDAEGPDQKFHETQVLEAYRKYEQTQLANPKPRMESLTRDWLLSEAELTKEAYTALTEALECEEPKKARQLVKEQLNGLLKDLDPMGIFQIDNPIKAKAIDAIRDWNRAGIGFRLITGDNKNAAKLIAVKLFPDQSLTIYDSESLNHLENWQTRDLAQATVIFTDTKSETLEILDRLDNMGSQKPNIIFCQMKDVDKKILVDHAKTQGLFIIANGDGCNDILMLKSAHISIGDAALDGSFSRGVKEASTFTDLQLGQLMKSEKKTLYQLLDLHKGKESVFLNHFAPIANTQPKIISALVCKCLKSAAIPKMLGLFTREIPHQFSLMLAYDAIFFAAIHQASMATASITFVAEPISHSYIPIVAMIFSVALAALQSGYCYYYQNEQITTMPLLVTNLFVSIGGLYFFMAPPGYAPKKRIKNDSLASSEQIVITPRSRAYSTF
jgi:hypothetical protein